MPRYIDADKIEYSEFPTEVLFVTKADVDAIPTADVQEVKHGKWRQIYEKYPKYVCTACNHLYNNKSFKFCPNCGARCDL